MYRLTLIRLHVVVLKSVTALSFRYVVQYTNVMVSVLIRYKEPTHKSHLFESQTALYLLYKKSWRLSEYFSFVHICSFEVRPNVVKIIGFRIRFWIKTVRFPANRRTICFQRGLSQGKRVGVNRKSSMFWNWQILYSLNGVCVCSFLSLSKPTRNLKRHLAYQWIEKDSIFN